MLEWYDRVLRNNYNKNNSQGIDVCWLLFFHIKILLSFHVFVEKLPVKVIPDGVINETLGYLQFSASLILEDHIIIPPKEKMNQRQMW